MAAKFKIKLKLQGFELEVEGAREDIPALTQNVGAQLAGLLMPAANMVEGKAPASSASAPDEPRIIEATPVKVASRKRSRRAAVGSSSTPSTASSATIAWKHDANTWGVPKQTWKATDKAIWLMYVANKVGAATEFTANQLSLTFDTMFRTAGKLNRGNIRRDFAAVNSEPPAKIQTNATVTPIAYYLSDAGNKRAEQLVVEARGGPAPT